VKRTLVAFHPTGSCGWEIPQDVSCRTCVATERTSTAGWLISLTRGTSAIQARTAARIRTMEMTMPRTVPIPRLAARGGCMASAGTVSGVVVPLTPLSSLTVNVFDERA